MILYHKVLFDCPTKELAYYVSSNALPVVKRGMDILRNPALKKLDRVGLDGLY